MSEPRSQQMDVLPIHAFLGLWQAQVTNNNSDFRLIAETIGSANLQGGATIALLHLVNRDGPELFLAFKRLMTIGQQTIRTARHAQANGFLPADAAVAAQNFAIEILCGTSIESDGISLSISMADENPVVTAVGVLVPINVAASSITESPAGIPELINTLRGEFWDIENNLRRQQES